MTRWPDTATFLIAHAVAAGVYLVLFLAVPVVLAFAAIIFLFISCLVTGDMGGPLLFPIMILGVLLYAICVAAFGLFLFLVTGGLHLLCRMLKVSAWVAAVVVFTAIISVTVTIGTEGLVFSLALSAAFLTYWLAFTGSDAILTWVLRRLGGLFS